MAVSHAVCLHYTADCRVAGELVANMFVVMQPPPSRCSCCMSKWDPPQRKASVRSSYRKNRRKLYHSCSNYTCITLNLMGLVRSKYIEKQTKQFWEILHKRPTWFDCPRSTYPECTIITNEAAKQQTTDSRPVDLGHTIKKRLRS